ncbi:MAG: ketoacyl-ACP synthase III [Hyphomicrobiaceae bacterium]|nr:ketoacyl-ACP synthase III [Hyphomicrobiaceae bacterium]
MPIRIDGTGSAVPRNRRLSDDIDAELGKPRGWLFKQTGVQSRYICAGEDQVDLAVDASLQALTNAGLTPGDIDLLVFAAAVPYQSIPATAPLVQQRLGIRDGSCASYDINSTCLSFLTALDLVAASLLAGRHQRALVVASEVASRALPWAEHPRVAGLFGDGAAAAIVSPGDGPAGLIGAAMETYPSAYEACQLGAGGTRYDFHLQPDDFAARSYFEMDGERLFRETLKHFPGFLDRLLARAGWQRDEVDLVVPHQASPGALAHLAKKSGFRANIVVDIARDFGNQVAASLPTALDVARRAGRMPPGTKVLMLGTSAGISIGGLALVT